MVTLHMSHVKRHKILKPTLKIRYQELVVELSFDQQREVFASLCNISVSF